MNILLDTHIALWYLNGDSKLSKKAKSEKMLFLTHDGLLSDYNEKCVEIM